MRQRLSRASHRVVAAARRSAISTTSIAQSHRLPAICQRISAPVIPGNTWRRWRPGPSWPEIRYQPPHSSPLSPTCHCLESPRGDHGRQRGPADRLELRCHEICGRETATVSARHSKSVSATNMSVVFLSSGPPTGTYFLNHDSEALVLITSQWMSNVCAPLLPSTMSKCHQMRRSTTGTCSMD